MLIDSPIIAMLICGAICIFFGLISLFLKSEFWSMKEKPKYMASSFNNDTMPSSLYKNTMPKYMPKYKVNIISDVDEYAIVYTMTQKDEFFNKENFLSYAQKVFISMQRAWTSQKLKIIKSYENVDLYERHENQIHQYQEQGQRQIIEMIQVRNVELYSLKESGGKDALSVILTCSLLDYVVDEKIGKVISGDAKERINRMYKLTFVRDKNAKTRQDKTQEKDVECPNCGAHVRLKYSEECSYCNTFIVIDENDWILSDIEPFVIEKT